MFASPYCIAKVVKNILLDIHRCTVIPFSFIDHHCKRKKGAFPLLNLYDNGKGAFPLVNLYDNGNEIASRVKVYLPALVAATEVPLVFFLEFATARTLAAETVPRVVATAATSVVVLLVTVDVSTFLKLR